MTQLAEQQHSSGTAAVPAATMTAEHVAHALASRCCSPCPPMGTLNKKLHLGQQTLQLSTEPFAKGSISHGTPHALTLGAPFEKRRFSCRSCSCHTDTVTPSSINAAAGDAAALTAPLLLLWWLPPELLLLLLLVVLPLSPAMTSRPDLSS